MKKFTAILVAVVLALTCLLAVGCNITVKVYMHDYDGHSTQIQVYDGSPLPTPPAREGYTFGGWYTDSACTKAFVDGTDMDASFHVYAKWTPVENQGGGGQGATKAMVIFNYNYEGATTTTKQVDKGSTVDLPSASREGYVFDGWWTLPTGGTQWKSTDKVNVDILTLYAHWTEESKACIHDFGNSYFMFVACKNGCGVYGRAESNGSFLSEEFVYDFNSSVKTEIDQLNNQLKSAISSENANSIIELFTKLDEKVAYVQGQYYIQSTWADVYYYDDDVYAEYNTISDYYNTVIGYYYDALERINKLDCADTVWAALDWSKEEVEEFLASDSLVSAENQTALNNVMTQYSELSNEIYELEYYKDYVEYYEENGYDTSEIFALLNYYYGIDSADKLNSTLNDDYGLLNLLFDDFVNVNNAIAKDAGDYENYTYYSYANDYNRNYAPSAVVEMRNYVKTYIGDIFAKFANEFDSLYSQSSSTQADADFWNCLEYYPMFMVTLQEYYEMWSDYYSSAEEAREDWEDEYSEDAVRQSADLIGNYFKWLDNTNDGGKINFFDAVNDVYANGNYFSGDYQGAYTMWIPTLNKAIMYFGDGYQTPFTFVHEFGHYYENVYNGGLALSYDHDETQSQGNEMLFLAWLGQNKGSVTDGYDLVKAYQLADILLTIIMSTAVDEFEQLIYSGETTYNGQSFPTMASDSSITDYNELYKLILSTYVNGNTDLVDSWMSADYWQVAFDSPCYYISYAMSALVSVEIYVEAMNDLSAARDIYFKLFTFGDSDEYVETVTDGDGSYKYLKDGVTYSKILAEWCGIKDAFDQTLYTDLQSYFLNN
ncbi:MAG: InlB B-repeat-containing protein [Clostridiales bacterium]|nr:InlB B-repeat-containing protein [Clostridiales bacterium]